MSSRKKSGEPRLITRDDPEWETARAERAEKALQAEDPIRYRNRALEAISRQTLIKRPRPPSLSQRQRKILDDLDDLSNKRQDWLALPPGTEEEEQILADDTREYQRAIGQAIRAGLLDDPRVRERLAVLRSFGERDALRQFGLKLETGIKRPMNKADFWLIYEAAPYISQGTELEKVRRILIRKLDDPSYVSNFIKPKDRDHDLGAVFDLNIEELKAILARLRTSRQNFHKWLKRLGLQPRTKS